MNYVGIDLGTTNSAICSYNGETVRLYKSPDQHDVTPSAIFFDKRGNMSARAHMQARPEAPNVLPSNLNGSWALIRQLIYQLCLAP